MLINFPLGSAYYGIHYQSDKQSSRSVSSKNQRYIIEPPLMEIFLFVFLYLARQTEQQCHNKEIIDIMDRIKEDLLASITQWYI